MWASPTFGKLNSKHQSPVLKCKNCYRLYGWTQKYYQCLTLGDRIRGEVLNFLFWVCYFYNQNCYSQVVLLFKMKCKCLQIMTFLSETETKDEHKWVSTRNKTLNAHKRGHKISYLEWLYFKWRNVAHILLSLLRVYLFRIFLLL